MRYIVELDGPGWVVLDTSKDDGETSAFVEAYYDRQEAEALALRLNAEDTNEAR
jgi:hypothetical protein